MSTCKRCYVSGRVQGVFYRDTIQRIARQLSVIGYAKNLEDGRVEVLMCGELNQLEHLTELLWQGSEYADVIMVECEQVEIEPPGDFYTG